MTEKLYYKSSYIKEFDAVVLSCEPYNDGNFALLLDKTAFFEGGGGMMSDSGSIGGQAVISVFEKDGNIYHIIPSPLTVGDTVRGELDFKMRMRRMQNHTGEHIISGLAHSLFDAENIGFHADESMITADFDKKISREDAKELELLANLAIYENHPITAFFPSDDEAKSLYFRAKDDGYSNLRLVKIEGVDLCACCALHTESSGAVGIIRIYDCIPHRGGCRIFASCGISAYEEIDKTSCCNDEISSLLSVKKHETQEAVERLLALIGENKRLLREKDILIADLSLDAFLKSDSGIIFTFSSPDAAIQRHIALKGAEKRDIFVCVFNDTSTPSLRYTIASKKYKLRALSERLKNALSSRGGGTDELITGSVPASPEELYSAVSKWIKEQ